MKLFALQCPCLGVLPGWVGSQRKSVGRTKVLLITQTIHLRLVTFFCSNTGC
jgi:hypothetical protein